MLRFIDSVQHYATGQAVRKWTSDSGVTIQTSGGDRNSGYIKANGQALLKTLTPTATLITGFRAQISPGQNNIMTVLAQGGTMGFIGMNSDATLSVGAGNNIIYTSTLAVSDPTDWHYYEIWWNASGVVSPGTSTASNTMQGTLWVDQNKWGTFSGTSNLALYPWVVNGQTSAQMNQFGPASSQNGTFNIQDLYVTDTSATDINSKTTSLTTNIGDVEIDAVFPDQDITTGWGSFGGDGTHAYTCVNESTPDDDTSYVFTTATGSVEAFEYTPISSFTGTILGAQYLVCAKKTAEGSREISMQLNGTNLFTSNFLGTANYLSDYYIYYIAPLDSALGTVWTTAVFNTSTFGVDLIG
jgi:hypothetical protein